MKNLLALSTILIILLPGCSSETDTTGTIKGEVYNSRTGSGIAVANVYTIPPSGSVSSDEAGNFKIENIDPGIYRVTARKFGYDSSGVSVSVSEGNITNAHIPLEPDSTLVDSTHFFMK